MTDTADQTLAAARAAFARRDWARAFERYSGADASSPLGAPDLEQLAAAAYLLGKDRECTDAWTRAHQLYQDRGDAQSAARCAFWLGFSASLVGDVGRGGGWFARGRRILDDVSHECAERAYLSFPAARDRAVSGDPAGAHAMFCEMTSLARRLNDSTLATLGRLGEGRCLMHMGRSDEGLALLDDVLVSVTLGEVSPLLVGTLYCSALDACHEMFDLRRAQEWTRAMTQWCESQPELAPYRGQCLVKRAEMMQLHGEWNEAMEEVRRACERFSDPPGQSAIRIAYYQQAELHRARGEFDQAEDAYRRAAQLGLNPQPGLALLRLAQGQVDAAVVSIRGELAEARDTLRRTALLPAVAEIVLAAGDLDMARSAADELARIADVLGTPLLRATSDQTTGAVLLAEGDARAALGSLRRAAAEWGDLEAPYAAARVRVMAGAALRALGDEDGAAMELEAARAVFEQLGAASDQAHVERLLRSRAAAGDSDLSARELQVLRLVADGRTNKQIASTLMISEKTVARHVSNIFLKLGVSTRAAATAYAYEHELV